MNGICPKCQKVVMLKGITLPIHVIGGGSFKGVAAEPYP